MKKLITNYIFDASAKTVTFSDYTTISLESVLIITNVTDNIIIYNFADASKGGALAGNVLTLDFDTTTQSDTDDLQIFIHTEDGQALSSESLPVVVSQEQEAVLRSIQQMINMLQPLARAAGIASDLRVTLLGGTTAVSGSLTTVATVTTVGGITNIGGISAAQLVPSNQNAAAVLSNINNVTVLS